MAHATIDAGADLVVGHHPHVVQDMEQYKDKWIAYTLGNFVFDQNFSADTRKGQILEVTISDRAITDATTHTVRFNNSFQPYMPEPANG